MDHRRPRGTPSILPWRLKLGPFELTKAEGIPEQCRFCFPSRATWTRESPAAWPSGPSETVNQGQCPIWCIHHPYRVAITPGSVPRGEGLRWHQMVGFGYPAIIVAHVIPGGVLITVIKVIGKTIIEVGAGEI